MRVPASAVSKSNPPISASQLPVRALPSAKPKAKDPNKREMSTEEKQKLGIGLQSLPPEKIGHVVDILTKRNRNLRDKDEFEVDVEALDTETLWELDRFVTNYKKFKRQALMSHRETKKVKKGDKDVDIRSYTSHESTTGKKEEIDTSHESKKHGGMLLDVEVEDGEEAFIQVKFGRTKSIPSKVFPETKKRYHHITISTPSKRPKSSSSTDIDDQQKEVVGVGTKSSSTAIVQLKGGDLYVYRSHFFKTVIYPNLNNYDGGMLLEDLEVEDGAEVSIQVTKGMTTSEVTKTTHHIIRTRKRYHHISISTPLKKTTIKTLESSPSSSTAIDDQQKGQGEGVGSKSLSSSTAIDDQQIGVRTITTISTEDPDIDVVVGSEQEIQGFEKDEEEEEMFRKLKNLST
ncbi:hypothetical protein Dsin_022872 [Dipteronia sinensis]|uniref:NET domain-containing protein n=1 Tax=Dipteronia sinensis TaxID=43782 RepID=A0AAE0A374_9ROSI|nr:hypothetical protein Dsin_022872 [Dipteronia sinensis]